ncbi:MAG: sensor histidine kinase [Pseudonocardiaceae bacterium]|nr:sensor histidine kinase [Pseudonocardiaceae bacterium]
MTTPELTLGWLRLGGKGRVSDGAGASRRGTLAIPPRARGPLADVLAVVLSALDVWLAMPDEVAVQWKIQASAQDDPSLPHSIALSAVACLALLARRRFPFTTLLVIVPGFLIGWAQLAAMIALWTLARRKLLGWQTVAGAALVAISRFLMWPLDEFVALSWREHALDVMWSLVVAGLPVALGLLAAARQELDARYTELKRSKEREQRLHAIAVREQERTRLAREMHDGVSHQVTLIAMQAGALKVAAPDEPTEQSADTIRQLSLQTLSELREMVGLLRTNAQQAENGCQLDPGTLDELAQNADVEVALHVQELPEHLPPEVSAAAYRTVQEALTNVYKHAPGANADVHVRVEQDVLLVEVLNGAPENPPDSLPSGGYGLAGLAERAEQLGGSFHAAATDDGGFGVRVSYPLQPAPAPSA